MAVQGIQSKGAGSSPAREKEQSKGNILNAREAYNAGLKLIILILKKAGEHELIPVVKSFSMDLVLQLSHYTIFALDDLPQAEYEQTLIDDIKGYRDDKKYIGKTKEF